MMRSLFTGASGMAAQQMRIDVTSHNLANANTVGFRSNRAEFMDLIYQNLRVPGGTSANGTPWPDGLQVGLGVSTGAISKDFRVGSPMETGAPLDLMIAGDGFFQVQLPDGSTGYTRAGNFTKDVDGSIVMKGLGYFLQPGITLAQDSTDIVVGQDGTVSEKDANGVASEIGQILIVRFVNPGGLEAVGDNLFKATAASGDPIEGIPTQAGYGKIMQNYLEGSNVSVVDELVNLIISQRAFEANSKSVSTSDEMLQTAVNLKR
ncbi:MAG: flagellar basal-body rod protein FlgG [bacterium]|nr:flagellar basal-body rod protein FlgG [bacterium]